MGGHLSLKANYTAVIVDIRGGGTDIHSGGLA